MMSLIPGTRVPGTSSGRTGIFSVEEPGDGRIHWVDSLKAIGIFLVVLAHHENELPPSLLKYIYSFHMPLFFFISGFLYRPGRYQTIMQFIHRRIKTLLIPYFALSLVSYAAMLGFSIVLHGMSSINFSEIVRSLSAIAISSSGIIPLPNGPMWFITCLFIVEVLFYFIHREIAAVRSRPNLLIALLIAAALLGFTYRRYVPVRLPWGGDTAFTVLPFYAVGFLAGRTAFVQYELTTSLKKVLLAIPAFGLSLWAYDMNGFVNLVYNKTGGNFVLFYLTGLSSIAFLAMMSISIPRMRAVEYIGKNTIVILALHFNAYSLVWRVPRLTDLLLSVPSSASHLLGVILLSTLQIVFIVPAIWVIRTFFPFIIGGSLPREKGVHPV